MYLLILSVLLRTTALVWSLHLLIRRIRDVRLGFVVAVAGFFLFYSIMPVLEAWSHRGRTSPWPRELEALDDLAASTLILLMVMFVGRMVEQRDRVVESLSSSEERYRGLVEQSADAVFVHSKGQFVFVNRAGAALLGASSERELIGTSVADRLHPDCRAQTQGRLSTLVVRSKVVTVLEEKYLRLDGSTVEVEVKATACEFEGIRAVQVIARDISARKRAEEHLIESRAVLEMAQAVAHVGSWVWTDSGSPELAWSAETFRIFGLDPAAFDGKLATFFACVHPDDIAKVNTASEQARAEERRYSVDHRIVRPDGQVRWVHEEADIVTGPSGSAFRMIGVVQDITERKLAQEALEDSERRYRQLFQINPQPMWVYDIQTQRFLAVNDAAVRHYGYSRDEFLRMNIEDIRPPEDLPAMRQALASLIATGTSTSKLWRHRRKDGSNIDVEVTGQNVPFIGPYARLLLARDITEQRRAERLLSGQGKVLELLARGATLETVLGQLAETFQSQIDGASCVIFLLGESGTTLRAVTAPSLSPEFLRGVDRIPLGPRAGPCAAAVERQQRVVVEDTFKDPAVGDRREHLLIHGIRACWSQPIVGHGGKVFGTLAMVFRTECRPQGRECEILEAAASLAGIAAERRHGEQALQEASDRLRAIIWSSPLPILATDADGRIRLWNGAAERAFGWAESEVLGQPNPLVAGDVQSELRSLLMGVLGGESIYSREVTQRKRDGSPIELSLSAAPLFDQLGVATGVMAVLADVTESKRTEQALRESEERLEFAQFCAEAGTWDWNIATGEIVWSEAYYRVFGLDPRVRPSLLGWRDSLHPDDRERTRDYVKLAMAEQRPDFRVQFRTIHPERGLRWLDATGRILYENGQAVRSAGIVIDITDRKVAEDAALDWKNRYEAAGRASRQLLYDWDPENNRITWGGNAEEILGLGLEELGDLDHWLELVHPSDRPALREEIDRVIATHKPFYLEHRVRRRDGQYIEVAGTGSFYPNPGGVGGRMIGFVADITQRKRLENELRQTQKLDAIGRLASGVAHDFNNLLTAIFGYTSLARRTLSPNHPATRALDRVDEAAGQASGVTKGLLTFSRENPSEKRPLNLTRAVEESLRLLRRTLPASIELKSSIEQQSPVWVRGDATQLQQVVINLAINARDAMPNGGVLRVSLSEVEEGEGGQRQAMLTISDTGTGIPPEVLPRIFEPFFTTKPPGEGTGLGLSIIHGIVADHGGRIDVHTESGHGASFTVTLACSAPALPQGRPVPQPTPAGQGELILLADDHNYVREIMSTMLRSMGYQVVQASDGGTVLGLFREHRKRARVIIVDEDMPGCSGWGCIDAIRDSGDGVPAIVMAGAPAPAGRELPARTRVLRKPFQMHELAAAVTWALAGETGNGHSIQEKR